MRKFTILGLVLGLMFSSFGQTYGDGVIDIDGNEYQTVIIGGQEWMAENLRVSRFNDGSNIANITSEDFENSSNVTELNYPWTISINDSSEVYDSLYGKLYNVNCVKLDSVPNICPVGWKVPDSDDFQILFDQCIMDGWMDGWEHGLIRLQQL